MADPASAETPAPGERVLKLSENEAPFAPSPRVLEAIRDIEPERLRAYPTPTAEAFREAAAKLHGLDAANVLPGNGSDDVLSAAVRTFVAPGGRVASPWPTYGRIEAICQIHGSTYTKVDWPDDWSLPTAQLLAVRPALIYLANPNAPSGTTVPVEQIATLAGRLKGVLLVDEAYVNFADSNCLELLAEHDNLIITRSLSKGYALAGLRFAYALAGASLVEQIGKVKDPFSTSSIAQAAAIAALQDQEHAQRLWHHVKQERARLILELQMLGFDVPPSQANFVLARHPDHDAADIYAGLRKQGVQVRHWQEPGRPGGLRITVGTSQEINALLGALEPLVAKAEVSA